MHFILHLISFSTSFLTQQEKQDICQQYLKVINDIDNINESTAIKICISMYFQKQVSSGFFAFIDHVFFNISICNSYKEKTCLFPSCFFLIFDFFFFFWINKASIIALPQLLFSPSSARRQCTSLLNAFLHNSRFWRSLPATDM